MRIIFVGDFEYNSGSAQTLLYYSQETKKQNIEIALSGLVDSHLSKIIPTVEMEDYKPEDKIVFIFENILYLDDEVNPQLMERYLSRTERSQRVIIDTDAHFTGKPTSDEEIKWKKVFEEVSDIILQPKVERAIEQHPSIKPFLFFAAPPAEEDRDKTSDFVYVGNNWHRTKEMNDFLVGLGNISSEQRRTFSIYGQGWDVSEVRGHESRKLEIKLEGSAPPNGVLSTMSLGRFNPIFIYSELLRKGLVTPRMFETLSADTVPLVPSEFGYAGAVYGESIKHFIYTADSLGEVYSDLTSSPTKVHEMLSDIRSDMLRRHSVAERVRQLGERIF